MHREETTNPVKTSKCIVTITEMHKKSRRVLKISFVILSSLKPPPNNSIGIRSVDFKDI